MEKCCIQRVQITSINATIAPNTVTSLNTPFSFANAVSCDKFLIVLGVNIPSMSAIGNVIVSALGLPSPLTLEMPCCPDNMMNDQLVGVGSLLVSFAKNSNRLRIIQAYTNKGCPMCLRKTVFYKTVITAQTPLAIKKKAVVEPNIEVK